MAWGPDREPLGAAWSPLGGEGKGKRLSAHLPQLMPFHLLLLESGPEIPRDPGQAAELEATASGMEGSGGTADLSLSSPAWGAFFGPRW